MGEDEPKKLEASAIHHDQEKTLIIVPEKTVDVQEKSDRDTVLAQLATEKRNTLIKAWEESEKAKADNMAYKKTCAVGSWEKTKTAIVEAELRKIEEELEKKKAEYTEKMKNKKVEIHREAEEKRANVEAKRGEEFHKIEKTAEKFRVTGYTPKKFLNCFSC